MGSTLSVDNSQTVPCKIHRVTRSDPRKRPRMSCMENQRLIPSLPDEISIQIIARVPRVYHLKLKLVSRAWKAAILGTELFALRKELRTTEEWLYVLVKVEDRLLWYSLDPLFRRWRRLPLMPGVSSEGEHGKNTWSIVNTSFRIADTVRGWFRKMDQLDPYPFYGCAVGAVDGCLYVFGGLSKASAMSCVLKYNPILNVWSEINPMSTGRAFCKAGMLNNKLYVAGGFSKGHGGLTSLHSAEVFDPCTGVWSEIPTMPFSKAQELPTAYLANLLKPMATGMTTYRGRLFVTQCVYSWPFFVDMGGEVYDPDMGSWCDMPAGMGEDWPVKQAGSKLGVTVEGELYAFEPSSSFYFARIKVYDYQSDSWKCLAGDIPICGASNPESAYLLTGLSGQLHAITKDENNNIVVRWIDVDNHLPLSSNDSIHQEAKSAAGPKTPFSTVIATKSLRSAELVSCLTLDL